MTINKVYSDAMAYFRDGKVASGKEISEKMKTWLEAAARIGYEEGFRASAEGLGVATEAIDQVIESHRQQTGYKLANVGQKGGE